MKSPWRCALELRSDCTVSAGSRRALAAAICRGADLRVYTEFYHEEHIAPFLPRAARRQPRNRGLIREVIDFRETVLLAHRHVAGITLLRQPLEPTTGFNGREPRLAFFLYNMGGQQACANLWLGPGPFRGRVGTRRLEPPPAFAPKLSVTELFDAGTSGPARNFIWDMEVYRFFVADQWREVLAHDERGRVRRGSFAAIERAQRAGRELKVALRDVCADLGRGPSHEVFSLLGSGFVHTGRRFYEALTHPLVRVAPAIPLAYASRHWDVSWVFVRTDGFAVRRTLDPYTRQFTDHQMRLACRWFVR